LSEILSPFGRRRQRPGAGDAPARRGNLIDDEVRFRFRAIGLDSSWVIDDVYVDPYEKGWSDQ
jgi:hypothetical protein